ncbi:MAG: GTP cyclohydrolase II [Paracoccaceae bacterium]
MSLTPTPAEFLNRARSDFRAGLAVVLVQGGVATVALAAETVDDARLADLRELGQPVLAITKRRAETLKVRCYDRDISRITVPGDVDISWITALIDPAGDLRHPLKGPLAALRGGDGALARGAIALAKAARLLPAAVVVAVGDGPRIAGENGLTCVDLDELDDGESVLNQVVSARVPLSVSRAGRVHVFRPDDGGEEHYAVEIGQPDRAKPVLTRLHSACFTGDLLGSLKCDCGPQLRAALAQMGAEGAGVLLYLNQEGRGIGLANKMRAYSLQDQGFDTVEANHRLGFEDDERDFRIGAHILKNMGFSSIRLLTNNPAKVAMMQENDVKVCERVPLKAGENPLNADYLKTKARKSGHIL